MKKFVFRAVLLAIVCTVNSMAMAAQATLPSVRDNSIYGDLTGNSNGAADHVIVGKAGGATTLRRGLIAFDVASLPANIRVDRVSLELVLQGTTNQEGDARQVSLHRLLAGWGEGTSNGGPGGMAGSGNGAPATANDATWQHRFFNTQTWSSPGADFVNATSATATVGIDPGVIVKWETLRTGPASGLVADVEHWLATPASNFGWLLKVVDEQPLRTARRFYSKEEANATFHPRLVVDYTIVPEPATMAILCVAAGMVLCGRRPRSQAPCSA